MLDKKCGLITGIFIMGICVRYLHVCESPPLPNLPEVHYLLKATVGHTDLLFYFTFSNRTGGNKSRGVDGTFGHYFFYVSSQFYRNTYVLNSF